MNLLVACYELGHQPLSLAWPLAFLKQAGIEAAALDLAVEPFSDELAARAGFVGIAAPMHTALRLGVEAAARVRALNPRAHICFFGLYAWLNEDHLLNGAADSVIAGEYERPLVELIGAIRSGRGHPANIPGVSTPESHARPILDRLPFPVPERAPLPALDHYARCRQNGHTQLAGYVEASRGCLHTCLHCPIVPIYNGRFFIVPAETVLADIRQQVEVGARHITFGDPDFLNGPRHGLNLARALHAESPSVTFDFTAKVEHILKHRDLFPEFANLGCTFVVSAIESVSDLVLKKLDKRHTAADIDAALNILDSTGIAMQPTLVAFTPWTTLDDYLAQIEFIHARGLVHHIPPIQLSIRLLAPPRSALLSSPDAREWVGELDPPNFTYRWRHPDPRMDDLQSLIASIVEEAGQTGEPDEITHARIRELAYQFADIPLPPRPAAPPRPAPPRLTENWFC